MLRPNRAYKKGAPHRDARLFVIVAEGDREDAYFNFYNEINSRIRIKKVPRDGGKSSPKFFLDRVHKIIESGGWSPQEKDELWFICDVDKWERKDIDELFQICDNEANWNLAISNPCFEVWLHLHSGPLEDNGETAQMLKADLPKTKVGQFEAAVYCKLIEEAYQNAKQADEHPDHYFPDRMQTKLYLLAQNMIPLLGKNWK
jgi:hypothetical protein